jgi:hypothetical protein
MDIDDLGPRVGKVFLYLSDHDPAQLDLTSLKPSGTIKCAVTPTVGPVLNAVARKFSPVKGMLI